MFDQLQSNKHLIEYQQEEIEKAQNQLQQLKDCLILQKETLNSFLEENRNLREEISRRCLINNNNDDLQNLSNDKTFADKVNLPIKNNKRKSENIEAYDSERKRRKDTQIKCDVIEETPNCIVPKCSEVNISLTKIKISCLENKIISCMKYNDGDLIIGCSDGFLIKYNDGIIKEFNTINKSDILYISTSINKEYFGVFKKEIILIFDKNDCTLKEKINISKLYLAEIDSVYENNKFPFICLNNGFTKRVTRKIFSFKISDTAICNFPNVQRYFHRIINGASFVTLEDSLFYKVKVKGNGKRNLELVSGLTDIMNILTWSKKKYICASEDCVWLIDSKFEIFDILSFINGIKFIKTNNSTLAVIDNENTVHLYLKNNINIDGNCQEHNDFKYKIYERNIEGNITAVDASAAHVL